MYAATDAISIDCSFPGGNVVLDGIDGDVIRLHQDMRDTAGWWFYWAFRVRHAQGRTLQFEFTDRDPVGVRGPAVSTDRGATWAWLGTGDTTSFPYVFAETASDVRFAFTIPYLQSEWEQFLARHADNPRLRADTLCTSPHGRTVESAFVAPEQSDPPFRVLLTSRHHCCEAMATYALEGLLDAGLRAETPATEWLAANTAFFAVPFVDKDGVEEGDQGKNRKPRDHGRDYEGECIYPETRAIRERVPEWSRGRPLVTLDLHCPWIRGKHNTDIYIVGSAIPRIWTEQERLGTILESACKGPLPYKAANNLPFGTSWNTAANYKGGKSIARWAGELPNVRLAASFEIPYADAGGVAVTADSARAFGRDLADALARYLREE